MFKAGSALGVEALFARPFCARYSGMVVRGLCACLLLAMAATGCGASQGPWVWVWELPPQKAEPPRIKPGDTLQVTVRNQAAMSGQLKVQPNGTYVQPQLGAVVVTGLTEQEASARVAKLLEGVLVRPEVNVAIAIPGDNRLSVIGEVTTNGRVQLRPEDGMLELLSQVGGLTQFADHDGIYLIRKSGKATLRVRFDYDRLVVGDPKSIGFKLLDGDVVTVK